MHFNFLFFSFENNNPVSWSWRWSEWCWLSFLDFPEETNLSTKGWWWPDLRHQVWS